MKPINTEYYGDSFRWFVATVIDNSPPYGYEGRIQIRVHGIHSRDINDIPQRDLPWAQVMTPSDTFGGSGLGTHCQILPGTLVFGMFLDGEHSQLPMVMGSLPRVEYPSSVQSSGRVDPATNPFAYVFQQSNSQLQDPVFYNPREPQDTEPLPPAECARFFIDNGLNAKQASSLTGVLQEISNLDPAQNTNGYGIAGWPPGSPRYSRFVAYTKRLEPSRSIADFEAQLIYVMQEIKTSKSVAFSKISRAREITGTLYGEKVDGIEERGNGQVAALVKYYVHPLTECDQLGAESKAEQIYLGLGAR